MILHLFFSHFTNTLLSAQLLMAGACENLGASEHACVYEPAIFTGPPFKGM